MNPGLFLRIWVLHEVQLGAAADVLDVRDLYEVVYTLALVFQVEAGILQGLGELDNRLADLVDLFLGRDLKVAFSAVTWESDEYVTNHDIKVLGLIRENDGQVEQGI